MYFKIFLPLLSITLLAACASQPQQTSFQEKQVVAVPMRVKATALGQTVPVPTSGCSQGYDSVISYLEAKMAERRAAL